MQTGFHHGNLSDPVHGYIAFTGLEREIIDHPVTQRLRHVSQTGLGYLVYPELRSVRFSHCLGTMHLSSQFLAACLRNSDAAVRDDLVRGILTAVEAKFPTGSANFPRTVELPPVARTETAIHAYTWCADDRDRRAIAFAEQALRLAALFHDLGHLAFSHDFEFALDQIRNDVGIEGGTVPQWLAARIRSLFETLTVLDANRFHEVIGPELGHLVLRDILANHGREDDEQLLKLFDLAFDIWTAQAPHDLDAGNGTTEAALALSFLKSIISGQLDVDRCDYILRDGRNYGFAFAPFDLPRLVGQLVVARLSGTFVLAVRAQGVGFLESFVLSRYRSYQFGVLHHKVSQVAAALQYAIGATFLNTAPGLHSGATQFLDDLKTLVEYRRARLNDPERLPAIDPQLLYRFALYDDVWWTVLMRNSVGQVHEDAWVNLVLWRSRGVSSLWKRPDDFSRQLSAASLTSVERGDSDPIPDSISKWNARLEDLQRSISIGASWQREVRRLRGEDVLVLRKVIPPLKLDNEGHSVGLYVHVGSAEPVALTSLSPLTRSLGEAWKSDLQVQAFARVESHEIDAKAVSVIDGLWTALTGVGEKEGSES